MAHSLTEIVLFTGEHMADIEDHERKMLHSVRQQESEPQGISSGYAVAVYSLFSCRARQSRRPIKYSNWNDRRVQRTWFE
jgi:hypothetical protein